MLCTYMVSINVSQLACAGDDWSTDPDSTPTLNQHWIDVNASTTLLNNCLNLTNFSSGLHPEIMLFQRWKID